MLAFKPTQGCRPVWEAIQCLCSRQRLRNVRVELWVKAKILEASSCAWGYVYKKFPLKSKLLRWLVSYALSKFESIWLVIVFLSLFYGQLLKRMDPVISMDSGLEWPLLQVQATNIKLSAQSKSFQESLWLKEDSYSKLNPSSSCGLYHLSTKPAISNTTLNFTCLTYS